MTRGAAVVLLLALVWSLSQQQEFLVEYEVNLHSINVDQILQEVAEKLRNLVPDVKYPGWQEIFTQEVDQMVQDVKVTHGLIPQQRIVRRSVSRQESLVRDYSGVHILEGVERKYTTKAKYSSDINIFSLPNKNNIGELDWYVVALESDTDNKKLSKFANKLVIYKYNNEGSKFYREVSKPVLGGVDVEIFSTSGIWYAVVAEHDAGKKLLEGSTVYKIIQQQNEVLSLEYVQTLNTKYPQDIKVWDHMNQVFLAVAQSYDPKNTKSSGESLVYQWKGQHFDLINVLPTNDARKVNYFNVGSSMFLAFANHRDQYHNTEVHSEIFKYNLHNDKFESYQRIKTHGAMDIKVFCFRNERQLDHYMIIANMYKTDMSGFLDLYTESVIYKLVDDYFIPFQSLEVPAVTHWEPIVGEQGEFVLLGASKLHGVVAVQHNGWKFVLTDIRLVDEKLELHVDSLRSFTFMNKKVVALASRKNPGDAPDILELKFQHINMLGGFYESLESWCSLTLSNLEQSDVTDILTQLYLAPKQDSALTAIGSISFTELTVGELLTNKLQTPHGNMDSSTVESLNAVHSQILNLTSEINTIADVMQSTLPKDDDFVVTGNLEFGTLELACVDTCNFENVQISTLNGQDFEDFLNKTLDTRDNLTSTRDLIFNDITVVNDIKETQIINQVNINSLVDKTSNVILQHPLTIYGHTNLENGASVLGQIDGIHNHGVVKNGTLHIPTLKVKNINTPLLNDVPLQISKAREEEDMKFIDPAPELRINHLIVDGLFSGINFTEFVQNSLKTSGQQTLSGPYYFENLIVEDNCKISGLMSNLKVPEDIALINEGSEIVLQELRLKSVLSAEQIVIHKSLNDIAVKDGKLRVLLHNSNETQIITAPKIIDNVHVTSYGKLEGSLNGVNVIDLSQQKTVVIKDDLNFYNLAIRGKTTVDGPFYASEFYGGPHPVSRIFSKGLNLKEQYIHTPFEFKQSPVKIKWLQTKNINDVDPSKWLRQDSNEKITGEKIFTDNLYFAHPIIVNGLTNGIDLKQLDSDVLRINGDQEITGHKSFSVLTANRIQADIAHIRDVNWKNILFAVGDQNITGEKTIFGSVFVSEEVNVDQMNVNGKIGGIVLGDMFSDSIFQENHKSLPSSPVFTGTKEFQNIVRVENISVTEDPSFTRQVSTSNSDANARVTYTGDITFEQPVTVKQLYYDGLLDDISADFSKLWLLKEGDQTMIGNQKIKEMEVSEGTTTTSGIVNDINFYDFANNAVYINQNHNFEKGSFDGGLEIPTSLTTDGNKLQGFDITKDVVLNDQDYNIIGTKTFTGPVTMEDLTTTDPLSGFSIKNVCEFTSGEGTGSLRVIGSVQTMDEPHIDTYINGYSVSGFQENVWYKNRDTEIHGFINFEKHIDLHGNIEAKSSVDGIDLQWLANNYFSKSKVQKNIIGDMIFTNIVEFKKDIYAHKANVNGYINDLLIQDFAKRVMLDGPDQSVIDYLILNEVYTQGDVELNGLFNNVNISQDYMLTYGHNVVKGKKVIQVVNCKDIHLPEGAKLQGVDVPYWVKKAVRTSGNFSIKGIKRIHDASVNSMELGGTINRMPFSTQNIMVNGLDQTVTGKKTFIAASNKLTPPLSTYELNLDGLLNDMDFAHMCSNIAYKHGRNEFSSFKNLTGAITADNLHVNGLYHGVNISFLNPKLLVPKYLHDFEGNFHDLMESARIADLSLAGQAVFLSHYKVIQTFGPTEIMFPIYLKDSQVLLGMLTNTSEDQVEASILTWSDKIKKFVTRQGYIPKIVQRPYYIEEEVDKNFVTTCDSELVKLIAPEYYNDPTISPSLINIPAGQTVLSLPLNGNHCLVSLELPTSQANASTNIFCETQGKFQIHQQLTATNPLQSTAINIYDKPHLFVIQGETPKQESSVEVWKLKQGKFIPLQAFDVVNAVGIAAVQHEGQYILAIASGLVQEAAHHGSVYLLRYDEDSRLFKMWTKLAITAPTSIKFATLSSGELVLYVLTSNQAQPFSVFIYKGEEGFLEKTHATTIAVPNSMNILTMGSRHFVLLIGKNESTILEAKIKGHQS